ncbi:large conductance mechanosensitive channel protein MscL [Streptomyces sp. NPDC060194]|uniref:large conductance mechanosensitive channel protein MscL n=1 Tax=Streptomyces sp. NPDC060194 TaxID=3347069 RepID=UPI00364BF951
MSEKNTPSQDRPSVLDGFKTFLMRGNVIDLAVAVVIGAAFTNVVNSVVNGVINPLVGAFGTQDLDGYSSCLKGPCVAATDSAPATGIMIMWGSVLSAALSFLITAAVVYFLMVLPMARYLAARAARTAQKEAVTETLEVTELEVLKEIRDVMVSQRGPSGAAGSAASGGRNGSGGTGYAAP